MVAKRNRLRYLEIVVAHTCWREKGTMATLHVRNVPDNLYESLRRRAAAENRSLSAEVVELLQQVIGEPEGGRAELFERISRRRSRIEQSQGRFPSGVDLLREDRMRGA